MEDAVIGAFDMNGRRKRSVFFWCGEVLKERNHWED
jgi:hypothetical protein